MSETIKNRWRVQEYAESRSYTKMPYPRVIAEVGQSWFRDSTIAVLRQRTRAQQPFRRVVDLGCGVGDWTLRYLAFADRVTGVDISEAFLAQANTAAARMGVRDRCDFHVADLATWSDFEGADLVTVGAVLMYMDADECRSLLSRLHESQRPGDWLYVRVTVVNPGRREFATSGGHYRSHGFYRQLFDSAGYTSVFEAYSSSLATAGSLVRLGVPHRASRAATLTLNAAVMGARFVARRFDYCNWLLRRR